MPTLTILVFLLGFSSGCKSAVHTHSAKERGRRITLHVQIQQGLVHAAAYHKPTRKNGKIAREIAAPAARRELDGRCKLTLPLSLGVLAHERLQISCKQGSVKGPRVKHEVSITALIERNDVKYCKKKDGAYIVEPCSGHTASLQHCILPLLLSHLLLVLLRVPHSRSR